MNMFEYTNRERDSKRGKYSNGAVEGLEARFAPNVPSWLVKSSTWWSSLQQAAMGEGWDCLFELYIYIYIYINRWVFFSIFIRRSLESLDLRVLNRKDLGLFFLFILLWLNLLKLFCCLFWRSYGSSTQWMAKFYFWFRVLYIKIFSFGWK